MRARRVAEASGGPSGRSATNVPRPGTRATSPSWTRRWTALRAVMRLTPNSSQTMASEGSGSPGASREMRSRRACSIS